MLLTLIKAKLFYYLAKFAEIRTRFISSSDDARSEYVKKPFLQKVHKII